ncbi:helix-turn-helix transcriptional regulator [Candidatus Fermentibacteria bacterium]|nr:helix-turn-helix transcriptional regulator [Candidatus Fermentibacteria bacterium]
MSTPLRNQDSPGRYIQIVASDQGLTSIDSQLKGKILEMLQEKDMDFEEIVARSGRAKSTISAHMKALSLAGITTTRPDPRDARKRIFSLNGRVLVRAHTDDTELLWADRFFPDALPGDATTRDVFRFILTSLRVSLLAEGISIYPILERAGRKAGARHRDPLRADLEDGRKRRPKGRWHRTDTAKSKPQSPRNHRYRCGSASTRWAKVATQPRMAAASGSAWRCTSPSSCTRRAACWRLNIVSP